jgi:predicted transposase YdaD
MILGIRGIEESSVYQDIFSKGEAKGEAKGKIEGKAEGRAEGRAEGKAEGQGRGQGRGGPACHSAVGRQKVRRARRTPKFDAQCN